MLPPSFSLSVKTIAQKPYLYIQRAIIKKNKRSVESFSLGRLDQIDLLLTKIISAGNSLFLGEMILASFVEKVFNPKTTQQQFFSRKFTKREKILFQWLVHARALHVFSKKKLTRSFKHSSFSILQDPPKTDEIYTIMDGLNYKPTVFEEYTQQLFSILDYKPKFNYYDTTTVYFYSDYDELRTRAYAKDGKRGLPNIKLALSCTEDFVPLSFKIYPGITNDVTCLKDFLKHIQNNSEFKEKVLVFDAGSYSYKIIQQLENENYLYVCNADISKYELDGAKKEVIINNKKWILQNGTYKDKQIIEAFNEDNHQQALEKFEVKLQKIEHFTQSVTGKDQESKKAKITQLIHSLGLKGLLSVSIQDNSLQIEKNDQKIQKRKNQLRKFVLFWSLPGEPTPEQILRQYLGRETVEHAFRYLKTPLEVRPVYHHKKNRIKSHFFIVLLGYLHISLFRWYLNRKLNVELTLDQILEDLNWSSMISLEPRPGKRINYASKQEEWINEIISYLELQIKNEKDLTLFNK